MNLLRTHMVLMLLYALAASGFFTLLWWEDKPRHRRLFLTIFVLMMVGGIAVGWFMYLRAPARFR